jgi:glycosyltransferase involved in cell wall biosynthesis
MDDRVSVLIPSYNRERFIKECLNSILSQSYSNLEIIMYDDGSIDNTVSVAKQVIDGRIRIIEGGKNKGVGYARNQLLNACKTSIAVWQDDDDLSHPMRLMNQYNDLKAQGSVYNGCKCKRFTGWSQLRNEPEIFDFETWKLSLKTIPERPKVAFASIMFQVAKAFQFSEGITLGGEDVFWYRKMRYKWGNSKNYRPNWVGKVLYFIRYHHDRISNRKKRPEHKEELIRQWPYVSKEIEELRKMKQELNL